MRPTPAGFRIAALSPERRALLEQRLRGRRWSAASPGREGIERRRTDDRVPLTFAQARLFRRVLQEGRTSRNHFFLADLRGSLDVGALVAAARAIVRRHENLRTTFTFGEGEPAPVVSNPEPDIDVVDLGALPGPERHAEAIRRGIAAGGEPYDLERGPLVRIRIFRLQADHHVLLLAVHLIVFDVWSMGVTIRELSALYNAFARRLPSPLAELPFQYADFAVWQRRTLDREHLRPQLDYWREQLARGVSRLAFEGCMAPGEEDRPFSEAMLDIRLPRGATATVAEFSRRHGTTPFMTLLAAFNTLLFRHTRQTRIATGTPIANRNHPGTEALIGYFPNVLPTLIDLPATPTFADILERVRVTTLGAYAHQDVPFDRFLPELLPPPVPTVLTPILFSVQNTPIPALTLDGVAMQPLVLDYGEMAPFDLTLLLITSDVILDGDGETRGMLHYNANVYDRRTVEWLWAQYAAVLLAALSDRDRSVLDLSLNGS